MTREGELEAVRQKGKRVRATHLEVRYIASLLRRVRAGVIVPKYGHNSVERNLVKRRLRTLVRCELLPSIQASGGALEFVVRAMPSAYGAPFAALEADIARVKQQLQARSPGLPPTNPPTTPSTPPAPSAP